MNTIEIATAHNIIFRYELASTVQRILAFAVDTFILLFISIIFSFGFAKLPDIGTIFNVLIWTLYHLLFEIFNQGQSPGKMLVKLRVVTLKGGTPTPYDYMLRWVFRMFDLTISGGTIAVLFISSSKRNQRIGDIVAQTTVVSLQRDLSVDLASLNKYDHQEEILYPGIVRYNDNDMLYLKLSINRYVNYPNVHNERILKKLTDNFVKELNLNGDNYNLEFLKRLLSVLLQKFKMS